MPADSLESGNPGFGPLRIEAEKQGVRTAKVSGSWAEIDGVHINFWRSSFPFMSKNMRMAESGDLDFGSCWIVQTQFFAGI